MDSPKKCAIVYDFDGTLSKGDCAQHGLMPSIGVTDVPEFWAEVKAETKSRDGNEILTYLGLLAKYAREADKPEELSPERLRHHGAGIPLFEGAEDWFGSVNEFGRELNLEVSHFVISSGIEEMIRGTSIAEHFQEIYACKYHYDRESGNAKWPSVAIDFTGKTQYLFRINKGIENTWDNEAINKYIPKDSREFPFTRMIYLGDGDTDIPAMKMVKSQGGQSIAVFDPDKWGEQRTSDKIEKLIAEDRVSYVAPGNYSEGSQLDVTVKGILRGFTIAR